MRRKLDKYLGWWFLRREPAAGPHPGRTQLAHKPPAHAAHPHRRPGPVGPLEVDETPRSLFSQFLNSPHLKSMVYQDRLGTQQTCLEIKSHCSKRGRFIHAVCFIATTTGADRCGKRHFSRHLYIKINILPRQAQDKHRESTQNEDTFALGQLDGWIHSGLPACVDWGWRGQ